MSNNTKSISDDSGLLHSASVQVPSSDDLQQRILSTTKTLPQEHATFYSAADDKATLMPWLPRFKMPIALTVCLVLGLFVLAPINQPFTSETPVSQINPSPATKTEYVNAGTTLSVNEAPLSIEELEFYEVLLIQDELILAQF